MGVQGCVRAIVPSLFTKSMDRLCYRPIEQQKDKSPPHSCK